MTVAHSMGCCAGAAAMLGIAMTSPGIAQPVVSVVPTNPAACSKLNEQLYAWAEAKEKTNRKLIIPREFARVSADLDEFCGDQEFAKAQIALDWLNTCIKNYTKSYKLGFCQRNQKYFCGVLPESDACKNK
jgi:hypothetical protein